MPDCVPEILFEHDGMAMLLVLCAVDKCNQAATYMHFELLDSLRVAAEFQKVTISKLDPP